MRLNIIKTNQEMTCFCCPVLTRFILITADHDFPICLDCLFIYEDLMIKYEHMEMFEPRLIDRHINN